MPTTIFTPQMLRNGTRAVPEIPAGGGGGFTNTYSLDFDGVDDYVNVGSLSTLQNATEFSVSSWFKTPLSALQGVWVWFDGADGWLELNCSADGSMIANVTRIGSATYGSAAAGTLTADTWYNATVIFNGGGATNADRLKLYVNGNPITLTFIGTIPTQTGTMLSGELHIGERYNGVNYFNGNIDEVAIFDSAISIADVWNGSGQPTDLSLLSTPPVNWYRMGDNGSYKSPQWLLPNNENKDKVSNYSFQFDGVDDYVSVSDNSIGQTQNISYSIWVNLNVTTRQYIIGNQNSSNGGCGLQIESGDVLVFQMADGGNDSFFNNRVANFSTYAPINTWNHILATWDGTDSKIYINGVLRNTWSPTLPYTISGYDATFNIGWRNAGFSLMTNGKLDELALFDSAVSIGDVWDGSGQPIDVSAVSGLTNNWRMGEEATFSTNWTIPDQVGSNDGTSANMTIEDRVGSAPSSSNNAVSFNMDEVDRVTDVPS